MRARPDVVAPIGAAVFGSVTTGAVLTVAGVRSPVTGALTMLFVLGLPAVCAGLLMTGLSVLARAVVAGTAAILLVTVIAEVMLVTSVWSPGSGVVAVAVVCAPIAVPAALRYRRRHRSSGHVTGQQLDVG